MSTKRFIAICAFLLPIICNGQNSEIKLSCELTIVKQFSSGTIQSKSVSEIYDVLDKPPLLVILPMSDSNEVPGVTTIKSPMVVSFRNTSDANKWALSNDMNVEGSYVTNSITIDRNSGRIFTLAEHKTLKLTINGQGNCKKIDTTKKMF